MKENERLSQRETRIAENILVEISERISHYLGGAGFNEG
jgi:hypothetical protein